MKTTQLQLIKEKLLRDGSVSRNWCLKKFITRLGARVIDLKNQGMKITGSFLKTKTGLDYVYHLEK